MKKVSIMVLSALFLAACTGPQGPPGPQGPAGVSFLGQTFEYDQVYFDYLPNDNLWSVLIDIPSHVEVYESDAILVYRYTGSTGSADIWEMLPNVFFLDGTDMIQYVFNHTFFDVELLIDGNFNLEFLGPQYTDNQIFRFVVVPSEFVTDSGIDVSDYNAVMEAIEIIH